MTSNDQGATVDAPACRWKSALAAVLAITLLAAGAVFYRSPAARYVAVEAAWNPSTPEPASWNPSASDPAAEDTVMLQDAGMDIPSKAGGVDTHLGVQHSDGGGHDPAEVAAVPDAAPDPVPAPAPMRETSASASSPAQHTQEAAPPESAWQHAESPQLEAASQPHGSRRTDEYPQSAPDLAPLSDGPMLPHEALQMDENSQQQTRVHQKVVSPANAEPKHKASQRHERHTVERQCRSAEDAEREEVSLFTQNVPRTSVM